MGKKRSPNTQRSIKTAGGKLNVCTERQVGENRTENNALLFLLQVVMNYKTVAQIEPGGPFAVQPESQNGLWMYDCSHVYQTEM